MGTPSIAIIGAGIAGLQTARILTQAGLQVQLFDKARGPGGRMASRRTKFGIFDHGAQYFTARSKPFIDELAIWQQNNVVSNWEGKIGMAKKGVVSPAGSSTERFVGIPRMSAFTRGLSQDLNITFNTRIAEAERTASGWVLHTDDGEPVASAFDLLVVTTPPEQAVPFLSHSDEVRRRVQEVNMLPCWAVMAAFSQPLSISFDGLFIEDAPLSWGARNSSKPARGDYETWVLHGSPTWSQEHLESDKEWVADQLLTGFFDAIAIEPSKPLHIQAHRWRFALAENPLDAGCLWDAEHQIGVCGDWCMGSRVEGAYLSGKAMGERIIESISNTL